MGIGGGIAERLAAEGASVVVADVDEAAGSERVEEIEADGGRAVFGRMVADDTLAGRVMLCSCGGDWGLVPMDADTPVEPLP